MMLLRIPTTKFLRLNQQYSLKFNLIPVLSYVYGLSFIDCHDCVFSSYLLVSFLDMTI